MRRSLSLLFSLSLSLGALAVEAHAAPARTTAKVAASKQYTQRVTSTTPLLFGIAADQSGSNRHDILGGDVPMKKADVIAKVINQNLEMMVALSSDGMTAEGLPKFKPWFHVVGVGYSRGVRALIGEELGKVHSTTDLANSAEWLDENGKPALKPEEYVQMKWVDPKAESWTHMGEGLEALLPTFKKFVAEHPDAPAPIAMNICDGKPDGGQLHHMEMAKELKSLKTRDGHVLLFNVHIGEEGETFMFPNEKMIDALPMKLQVDARRLFQMSSPMPPQMLARARAEFPEYNIPDDARTMVYNATGAVLAKLLEMGTVQNLQGAK